MEAETYEELKKRADRMAYLLSQIRFEESGFPFICGMGGQKDKNGLPERLTVCAAYGSDVTATYKRIL